MTDDWRPRPAIYPGEWLDEEIGAETDVEMRKQGLASKAAERALAKREKYWIEQGMSDDEVEWLFTPPVGREVW